MDLPRIIPFYTTKNEITRGPKLNTHIYIWMADFTLIQSVNKFAIYTYTKGMFKIIYMHTTSLNQCWSLMRFDLVINQVMNLVIKKKSNSLLNFFPQKNLPRDYKKNQ